MASIFNQLCSGAGESLMRLLESSYLTIHEALSLDEDELLQLSQLSLAQQRHLIHHAHRYLRVTIDEQALRRTLQDLNASKVNHELENEYLLLGATLRMMRDLFGMHASEFSRRRQLLGMGGQDIGRPKQCTEKTEHIIWHQWQAHDHLGDRERFLTVAEKTGESLQTIWRAVQPYRDR